MKNEIYYEYNWEKAVRSARMKTLSSKMFLRELCVLSVMKMWVDMYNFAFVYI